MLGFLIFAAALFGLPFLFVAYKLKRAERNEYMNEVKEGPLPENPIVFAWSAWGVFFINITSISLILVGCFVVDGLVHQEFRSNDWFFVLAASLSSVCAAFNYIRFVIDFFTRPFAVLLPQGLVLRGRAIPWKDIESMKLVHMWRSREYRVQLKGNRYRFVTFNPSYLKDVQAFDAYANRYLARAKANKP